MKILQLPVMELQERIEQELEENPVLERIEVGDDPIPEDEAAEQTNNQNDNESDPDGPMVSDEDNQLDFNRLDALNRDWEDHFNEEHRHSRGGMEEESDRKHDAMQNM